MNKKFFMGMLAIMMVAMLNICLVSCGDDDDVEIVETLDKTSITLYVNESSELKYSGNNCIWSSDNKLIATVENGIVTAKHVGTTIIHANNLQCKVTVKPRYTSFTEPYMKWGCTKSEVKNYMSGYTLKSESSTMLTYNGKANVGAYGYMFENNQLTNSSLYVNLLNSIELTDYLLERYCVISTETENNINYFYLTSVDLKLLIVMRLSTDGSIVLYRNVEKETKSATEINLRDELGRLTLQTN